MSVVPLEASARLTLAQGAKLVGVAAPTTWRWSLRGNRYGIRLQTVVVGSFRYTTKAWLEEFIRATTIAADSSVPGVDVSPARKKRIEAARRELARR